jgi:hypothetical protein
MRVVVCVCVAWLDRLLHKWPKLSLLNQDACSLILLFVERVVVDEDCKLS